ncbi:GNAT family N-acetyltransferase [Acuticoccus kandeliae]|uniref:GNAT family N-acetyltransferase n=1 Tax=Acuticoccus kandeliae TaxID=2073160 RepID=UPI000D3E35AC|nr:GNAT family N-acetyltransferase [Acuticoccus kandeliae]
MTITFREAEPRDVAAIVAMLADDMLGAARETVSDPPDPRYFAGLEAIRANPHDHLILAEQDGEVVACAQLTFLHGLSRQGAVRALIEGVRVASSARGGGIGAELVAHLVAMAREGGAAMVQLTSDKSRTRAHAFYERLGFKGTHLGMKLDLTGG